MNVAVDINETCLTVAEVAERLKLSEEMARRLFLNEPGVIVVGSGTLCARISGKPCVRISGTHNRDLLSEKGRARVPDAAHSRERLRARRDAVYEGCVIQH